MNLLKRMIKIITLVVFSIIVLTNLHNFALSNFSLLYIVTLFLVGISIFALMKVIKKINEKRLNLIFFILLVLYFIIQLYFINSMKVIPSWDFQAIDNGAKDIILNGKITDPWLIDYFLLCPNNITGTMLYTFIYSIFGANLNVVLTFNAIFVNVSILLIYLISRQKFNKHDAFRIGLVSMLFLPYLLYGPIAYTDTLSMPLVLLFIFLIFDNNKFDQLGFKQVLALVLITFAILLKATNIIYLIAIILIVILKNYKKIYVGLVYFLIFLITYTSFNGLVESTNIFPKSEFHNGLPPQHFIAMGLNEDYMGRYNLVDFTYSKKILGIDSKESYQEFKKTYYTRILDRIFESNGGFTELAYNKVVRTWADGSYYSLEKLSRQPLQETNIGNLFWRKKFNGYLIFHMDIMNLLLVIIILVSFVSTYKEEDDFKTFLNLSLIGIFVFLLFWETRSRYLLTFTPLMIIYLGYLNSNSLNKKNISWIVVLIILSMIFLPSKETFTEIKSLYNFSNNEQGVADYLDQIDEENIVVLPTELFGVFELSDYNNFLFAKNEIENIENFKGSYIDYQKQFLVELLNRPEQADIFKLDYYLNLFEVDYFAVSLTVYNYLEPYFNEYDYTLETNINNYYLMKVNNTKFYEVLIEDYQLTENYSLVASKQAKFSSLEDVNKLGLASSIDSYQTQELLKQEGLNKNTEIIRYLNLRELASALMSDEIDAIIINENYFDDISKSTEGFSWLNEIISSYAFDSNINRIFIGDYFKDNSPIIKSVNIIDDNQEYESFNFTINNSELSLTNSIGSEITIHKDSMIDFINDLGFIKASFDERTCLSTDECFDTLESYRLNGETFMKFYEEKGSDYAIVLLFKHLNDYSDIVWITQAIDKLAMWRFRHQGIYDDITRLKYQLSDSEYYK